MFHQNSYGSMQETSSVVAACTTRPALVVGNWKMNKTYVQAVKLAQELSYKASQFEVETCVCPTHLALRGVANVISFDKAALKLGAQNVSWEADGAFTGEISAQMLKEEGCTYCIVGHSERRQKLHESDEQISDKICALIREGVSPILCCGEPLAVYEAGETRNFIQNQLRQALEPLTSKLGEAELEELQKVARTHEAPALVLAYEPIWAIGTGKVATPEYANEVCEAIREVLAMLFGEELAWCTRILYGGSVKAENASFFFEQPSIDGALVGGAALDAQQFAGIVEAAHG